MTVLGVTSDTLLVTSAVPQGSILGPALFLLHANDLPDTVQSSQVAMFAGDTKLFKVIKSTDDVAKLQADLQTQESWSINSGLVFNKKKCKTQKITPKMKPVVTTYTMGDSRLLSTKSECDLGVWICTDLAWNKQINEQCVRANKSLGYIRRNSRNIQYTSVRRTIYLTLIRSHFSFATQVWALQSIGLIVKLERTQRRATKYILNLLFNLPFTCYYSQSVIGTNTWFNRLITSSA